MSEWLMYPSLFVSAGRVGGYRQWRDQPQRRPGLRQCCSPKPSTTGPPSRRSGRGRRKALGGVRGDGLLAWKWEPEEGRITDPNCRQRRRPAGCLGASCRGASRWGRARMAVRGGRSADGPGTLGGGAPPPGTDAAAGSGGIRTEAPSLWSIRPTWVFPALSAALAETRRRVWGDLNRQRSLPLPGGPAWRLRPDRRLGAAVGPAAAGTGVRAGVRIQRGARAAVSGLGPHRSPPSRPRSTTNSRPYRDFWVWLRRPSGDPGGRQPSKPALSQTTPCRPAAGCCRRHPLRRPVRTRAGDDAAGPLPADDYMPATLSAAGQARPSGGFRDIDPSPSFVSRLLAGTTGLLAAVALLPTAEAQDTGRGLHDGVTVTVNANARHGCRGRGAGRSGGSGRRIRAALLCGALTTTRRSTRKSAGSRRSTPTGRSRPICSRRRRPAPSPLRRSTSARSGRCSMPATLPASSGRSPCCASSIRGGSRRTNWSP